ncbi:NAD(P)/FAD-dependent oxidoreductase [Variovorax sp. JS1663]|uniref:NAD(P)/FAD-dependent oxidoreductase n=1 Tax=Variovorax sp. JS1663 TaxID=1851577 RepID=UPI000B3435F9|nr:geranylgeranyl reductase family protein [Variovorax sp. JS1663]OUL99532.1 geranylgeranyl reductase [Variovorax sp. JS1663]
MAAAPEPADCDVLVVGAGPAGSACAQLLARAGADVLLVDRHGFPREKVCGDGLIPDAHRALARLGVLDAVLARACAASHVACVAPRGSRIEVPASLAVLPRRELDEIVRQAALAAGARWFAPARFEAPLVDADGRVVGARLRLAEGTERAVRARWTVLATGAAAGPLLAADMCSRRVPSGVALRGYVRNEAMAGRIRQLEVVWHRALRGGYGWIFPCGNGLFNVGAGLLDSPAEGGPELNLRALFAAFTQVHAPARELMQGGSLQGELKGAPLRCSLDGARWSRPGVLVTGEAAGSTYSFTGEGIGKAMETGMLAAEAMTSAEGDAAVGARYDAALTALKPRFAAYAQANRVNHHPWIADFVFWRAQRSPGIVRRLGAVLEESYSPDRLVTAGGLLRMMLPVR